MSARILDLVQSHPFPRDLLDLQRALDDAEAQWRARVIDLYQHPVMLRARTDGRQTEVAEAVRRAARAA